MVIMTLKEVDKQVKARMLEQWAKDHPNDPVGLAREKRALSRLSSRAFGGQIFMVRK
jgi:hypothetical protein